MASQYNDPLVVERATHTLAYMVSEIAKETSKILCKA